jgi:hypothetical protein
VGLAQVAMVQQRQHGLAQHAQARAKVFNDIDDLCAL